MPRKIGKSAGSHQAGYFAASMRPRHRCRGRSRARRDVQPRSTRFNEAAASMPRKMSASGSIGILASPGFNEAAASMPRKIRRHRQVLRSHRWASMRPRHRCRGRSAMPRSQSSRIVRPASMRPRHRCRGRSGSGTQRPSSRIVAASMRPRHRCRGR